MKVADIKLVIFPQKNMEEEQVFDVNAKLIELFKEVESYSSLSLIKEGWGIITRGASTWKKSAYKIAVFVGGVFTSSLIGGSIGAAYLAFLSTLKELKEFGISPVQGHISEWGSLSYFIGRAAWNTLKTLKTAGVLTKIDKLFKSYIANIHVPRKSREKIYLEMLQLKERYLYDSSFFLSYFPSPGNLSDADEVDDLLKVDTCLKGVFDDIKKEVNESFFQQFKLGWQFISWQKKIAIVVREMLFLGIIRIYFSGIKDSTLQGIDDYKSGEIPSILGHPIEWTGEVSTLLNLSYNIASQIAYIGTIPVVCEVFEKKIQKIDQTQSSLIKRVSQFKDSILQRIPPDFFFIRPLHLKFLGMAT